MNSGERREKQPHFMLVPSLACPAKCTYCFGPHHGAVMSEKVTEQALDFIVHIAEETGQSKARVTLHGGEPLEAGYQILQQALTGLADRFGKTGYKVSLQSNLWEIDKKFCQLFREHNVSISSSLDGPREITDVQRGAGYYDNTMRGIRLVQSYGMNIGCIATFTPFSAPRWREVFDFFLAERLSMSIHPSILPLGVEHSQYSISPVKYGQILKEMLDYYVEHRHEISVSSMDQICRGFNYGEGKICTFRDCFGMFLAIDPHGDIFSCQRFCGQKEYRLGNIADQPTMSELMSSPIAGKWLKREKDVQKACAECEHINYCKGGCLYNAWGSSRSSGVVDPFCSAYKELFGHISSKLLKEMDSEENINAIAEKPYDGKGHPLLKKGPLVDLVREGPHPSLIAKTAKRIIAAVEFARGPDIPHVAARLVEMGIARTRKSGEASLKSLYRQLKTENGLNNLYVHITFRCQLYCTHCYARADAREEGRDDMPPESIEDLIRQAKDAGFRQIIITGGEPLVHKQRDKVLQTLKKVREWASPMNIVFRTNLAMPLKKQELVNLAQAVDQVVVSVDGNEQTHDDRRGKGTYAAVIENLENYQKIASGIKSAGELSLAAVMHSTDIQGALGNAVRELANRLGVKRTRFRPLLPIGRAKDWDEPPMSEALGSYAGPMELIENGFRPVASCGLGQNLYIEPIGESFPCYAYHKPHSYLGNVLSNGLQAILDSSGFKDLSTHNVDTNEKCKTCELRYLCGGACRAWGKEQTQYNLDASPPECDGLRDRAMGLLDAAGKYLNLSKQEN